MLGIWFVCWSQLIKTVRNRHNYFFGLCIGKKAENAVKNGITYEKKSNLISDRTWILCVYLCPTVWSDEIKKINCRLTYLSVQWRAKRDGEIYFQYLSILPDFTTINFGLYVEKNGFQKIDSYLYTVT